MTATLRAMKSRNSAPQGLAAVEPADIPVVIAQPSFLRALRLG